MGGSWYAAEHILPYSAIKPGRYFPEYHPDKFPNGDAPERYGFRAEPFTVFSPDSVRLSCCILRTSVPDSKGTVVLLHGIAACKELNFGFARLLNDNGWDVVITDLRAHGKSGGSYCTFGYYEKHDVSAILTAAIGRKCPAPYGIFGASLGGAVALQTLAEDKRWNFGIIESTFDNLINVSVEYGHYWFGFRSRALAEFIMARSSSIAHFPADSVSPMLAARSITCPILLAHGDDDRKIPAEHTRLIFENLATHDKKRIVIHGAGHDDLHSVGGAEFESNILQFLARQKGGL